MLDINKYQFESDEEREAARGLMEAFAKQEDENEMLRKQKYLFINFINENDLEDQLVKFMKAKTNEGVNYWYERAASEFLDSDLENEKYNLLHDDYAHVESLHENGENTYFK